MRFSRRLTVVCAVCCVASGPSAWAGPPFLTDDPVPVDYRHHEFYVFGTLDRSPLQTTAVGPAFEYNQGVAPNVQFHIVGPYVSASPQGGPTERGIGDVETGIKYRFIEQTKSRPDVAIFPMAELPTGNSDRGLGNGQTWYRLPVWVQKDWGSWTSYGGGGWVVNNTSGQKGYPFGGILIQRTLCPKLTLGGEVFAQGASAKVDSDSTADATPGGRSFVAMNVGGYYNFNPDWSLLFSAGHTISGEGHTIGYLGLYWTWGPAGH